MADELLITTPRGGRFAGDSRDATFTVAELSGWFDRPGVKQARESRPLADGDFRAPSFREGKLPSWEGLILTRTLAEQHEAIESLPYLLGDGELFRLSVQGPTGTTWADVQLDDEPSTEVLVPGTVARYRVRLYSPGSFRFGDVQSFTSGERAFHRGTAPAVPFFTVTGTMPSGYSIESSLGTFTVTQGLDSGQTHTFNFGDQGWVYRNDVLQSGATAHPRQMWRVPPGIGVTHTLAPVSGSGVLTVKVTDTY